jgi:hypothetical protein
MRETGRRLTMVRHPFGWLGRGVVIALRNRETHRGSSIWRCLTMSVHAQASPGPDLRPSLISGPDPYDSSAPPRGHDQGDPAPRRGAGYAGGRRRIRVGSNASATVAPGPGTGRLRSLPAKQHAPKARPLSATDRHRRPPWSWAGRRCPKLHHEPRGRPSRPIGGGDFPRLWLSTGDKATGAIVLVVAPVADRWG